VSIAAAERVKEITILASRQTSQNRLSQRDVYAKTASIYGNRTGLFSILILFIFDMYLGKGSPQL